MKCVDAAYEGMAVWFNALIASAGGDIRPQEVGLPTGPTEKAVDIIARLAASTAADPSLSSQTEDQNRIAFESGSAAFQVNYPFIYPSGAEVSKDSRRTSAGRRIPPSRRASR